MQKVLIVDDDPKFLDPLKKDLQKYKAQFAVLTASDGAEAIEVLRREPVSVLVMDLVMPNVDGLELLCHMAKNHSTTPCIVMTDLEPPEIKKRADQEAITRYIQKPFDVNELALQIIEELDRLDEDGFLRGGVSLDSFLQLIEMGKKTCLLEVKCANEGKGLFYFNKGLLYDAICDDLKGEPAAIKMIGWDNVEIDFKSPPEKKIKKRIHAGPIALFMEEAVAKCESAETKKRHPHERDEMEVIVDSLVPEEEITGSHKAQQGPDLKTKKEVSEMALETQIDELKGIKGYIACAIMTFTGEVLASHSNDEKVDLGNVGATFNDIFRSAHEASGKVGLEACNELLIQTPKGIIVMACSGVEAEAHFHMIGILARDGNQALMKMQFGKMIPIIMKELA